MRVSGTGRTLKRPDAEDKNSLFPRHSPLPCALWYPSCQCKVGKKHFHSHWQPFMPTFYKKIGLHKARGSGELGPSSHALHVLCEPNQVNGNNEIGNEELSF